MRKKVNNFSGNVPTWLQLADLKIDYYTQFVKAWIPFNAWYTVSYHSDTLDTDRKILDEIKNKTNPLRDRIINLIIGSDNISREFRHLIGQLHGELEGHSIPNHDSKISFASIIICKNPNTSSNNTYRGLHYKVNFNVTAPKTTKRLKCEIIKASGAMQNIFLEEFYDWSMSDLLNHSSYKALSTEQKEKLRLCFEEVNPNKPTNIIVKPQVKSSGYSKPPNSITIDSEKNLYFVDDVELVSKVIIEALYQLRCALFHGEINPTDTNQIIYEKAYNILKTLIQELK